LTCKDATKQQNDDAVKDLAEAGQLKLKAGLHHFAAVKGHGESAGDFSKFGEIMISIVKKHGIADPHVEVLPLHNELD
jgi:hypothetical protein